MKLIIEYDPWAERSAAERAADALTTLGLPAELREVRSTSRQGATPKGPVKFEAAAKAEDWSAHYEAFARKLKASGTTV